MPQWSGKRVLITGVAGTVGQEIFRQLRKKNVTEIIGIDNNESEIFFLEQKFRDNDNVHFFLCDIRDRDSLQDRMNGCDVVLHSAAFKHVSLCESSPRAAVNTNIIGVQNIIDAAQAAGVQRVLFTSSDKAVNPTNVMGTSKLMGERLFTAANLRRQSGDTLFGVVRFGNVLGSRGSVIPIFKKQISEGGPITLTDPDMTRFIMTLKEAVNLVLETAMEFKGGEVFITKMPIVRIDQLAEVMIEELAPQYGYSPSQIKVETIGPRPGEKLYEELMNYEESRRAMESQEFFIITPALKNNGINYTYEHIQTTPAECTPYVSSAQDAMGKEELRAYLYEHDLIRHMDGNSQPAKLKVAS